MQTLLLSKKARSPPTHSSYRVVGEQHEVIDNHATQLAEAIAGKSSRCRKGDHEELVHVPLDMFREGTSMRARRCSHRVSRGGLEPVLDIQFHNAPIGSCTRMTLRKLPSLRPGFPKGLEVRTPQSVCAAGVSPNYAERVCFCAGVAHTE